MKVIQRNPLLRKSAQFPLRALGLLSAITAPAQVYQDAPPVLVNSFPKSGTHLLLQVVQGLDGVRYYGNFLASKPTLTYRKRSFQQETNRLRRVAPGEALPAHLHFSDQFATIFKSKNILPLFIFRDLRDVVVSEAFYLTEMNQWHRLHKYFRRLDSLEDRISLAILGLTDDQKIDYGDVGRRFRSYQGWLEFDDCLSIRFEQLVSDQRQAIIRKIAKMHVEKVGGNGAADAMTSAMAAQIAPERSHTFRQGAAGSWQQHFSERNKREMKLVAGELLIELGYTQDMDW